MGEPPKIIAPHPAVIGDYERKLERLEAAIAEDIGVGECEHAAAIRDLVQTVTVSRPTQQPNVVGNRDYWPSERAAWRQCVSGQRLPERHRADRW